ncbi:UvrD-helicase domain-containing protein [Psychrobacter sp. HD31]|uniref:UvrD-helicase domain-containing protein n=1 Tax=Psychrobacter sp. HD31 TaxID=3112003 RepID=UPI003DA3D65D
MKEEKMTNDHIPAININLSGKHLIEASAGTGKTWTLTGIVLRLLIEKKVPPEQIICTTFTRAAAAEMRQRIHERLTDFYHLLNWLRALSNDNTNFDWLYPKTAQNQNTELSSAQKNQIKKTRHTKRELALLKQAQNNLGIQKLLEDKVNIHLVNQLADDIDKYPLDDAIRRSTNLLTTLDKLFVSTLDSLAQKWLSEYSAETGFSKGMYICDDEWAVINGIIHDELRKFQSHIYHTKPDLYKILQQGGHLTSVTDYTSTANKALQFMSVPIEAVDVKDFDFDGLRRFLTRFDNHNCDDVLPYFDADFCVRQKFRKNTNLHKYLDRIPAIIESLQKHGINFETSLDANSKKLLAGLAGFYFEGKNFNKNSEKEQAAFLALPSIDLLVKLLDYQQKLGTYIDATLANLNRHIALKVREQLPVILEERNQTTFNLQMVRLNQTLAGEQGQKLAKYIRYQYPVALIDESQDINSEQADMIRKIYLSKDSTNSREFLLLVGDPKQAIYGFRGGDVANYNAVKNLYKKNEIHTLNQNFRSSKALIDSLNCWFGASAKTDDDDEPSQFSKLGEGIYYNHITAMQEQSNLIWQNNLSIKPHQPVSVIHLVNDSEIKNAETTVVAKHIASLINSNTTLNGKPLTASDFAILGRTKQALNEAESALKKLNIDTVKVSDKSIFDTRMAKDLLAVLQSVLNPFNQGLINRTLTSSWYGFSLDDVKRMQNTIDTNNVDNTQNQQYSDFQQFCKTAAQLWTRKGILTAMEYLLSNHNPLKNISVWEYLASNTNKAKAQRALIDLRQLLDILAQYTSPMGEHECITWLTKQIGNKTDADWAIQHPVPTQAGVELMTIHKSKGLEFPIVYILGMGSSLRNAKQASSLYLTSTTEGAFQARKLTTCDDENVIQAVENEAMAELKRLFYVALTRASEQVFFPLTDLAKKDKLDKRPTHFWLECADKNYVLPTRLKNAIGWQPEQEISDYFTKNKIDKLSNKASHTSNKSNNKPLIDYPIYDDVIKRKSFIGWAKTSFTALAHNLHSEVVDTAVNEANYDSIEQQLLDQQFNEKSDLSATQTGVDDRQKIRFDFVKGANAGSFLHKIFEVLDFDNPLTWSSSIDKCVVEFDLPDVYGSTKIQKQRIESRYGRDKNGKLIKQVDINLLNQDTHEQLKIWIDEVLNSSLTASNTSLKEILPKNRLPELGFSMKLGDGFSVSKISQIFAKYLGEQDERYINLATANGQNIYQYLRGEIDLVYQHKGKFYVVDYKSNHLGHHFTDYNQANLAKAMSKAGYWLQAMIYQVALHRLLKLRIADYTGNEANYLGAVEYMFVRGCVAKNNAYDDADVNANKTNYGKINWDIPVDMVLEMDKVFGY